MDNPVGLGAYNIVHEEERNKRGSRGGLTRDELWARFRSQVQYVVLNAIYVVCLMLLVRNTCFGDSFCYTVAGVVWAVPRQLV